MRFKVPTANPTSEAPQTQVELERELAEARDQLTTTSEILRAISNASTSSGSRTEIQPVFDIIAANALRLCGASWSAVELVRGEFLELAALHNVIDPLAIKVVRAKFPMPCSSETVAARVTRACTVVHVPDVLADVEYENKAAARQSDYRACLGVPMIRGSQVVGVIFVARSNPGFFAESQVELLKSFADQAVIAIENVRLFDELQEKHRQLEITSTYKSRFLAAASHDLRQPLHALNLFVAQLRAEADPIERDRLVAHIDSAVSSMNELFGALLDMSKLDAGVLEPNVTEFAVGRLLNRMQLTFAAAAREKRLRFRVVSTSIWVRSDFILLERVLLNLVSNAVRYTREGGIIVGCRRLGAMLRIDILDSGIGIPEDQQQKIFGEFYQLAEPGRMGGLGLGLSMVDRLCNLLGHTVQLVSRPGAGSRFSILVPMAATAQDRMERPVASPTVNDNAQGKLVVVIDDDRRVRDAMSGMLRNWGCHVVTAASDTGALAQLAQAARQPDLIISDLRLADGKTGIEAIGYLCAALGKAIPAFLISGDTAPEKLREVSASGYQLLHKPVSPMALRTTLTRTLSRKASKVMHS